MTDRYAVIGNPIAHSRSPAIHAQFAAQTGQDIAYERLLAPLDGFIATVDEFRAAGGRGCNVTVPFKLEAFAMATRRSPRASAAGAANTLIFGDDGIEADNTDGIGLVRDLSARQGVALSGARLLLLGAGGASRGVILPLLDAGVGEIVIANRTVAKARELAALAGDARVRACGYDELGARPVSDAAAGGFGLIVNATSAGLSADVPPLPDAAYAGVGLAYDMVYAAQPTAFMRHAASRGCARTADGLGMLVEQAAESFRLWRGVLPQTEPVYRALRDEISAG